MIDPSLTSLSHYKTCPDRPTTRIRRFKRLMTRNSNSVPRYKGLIETKKSTPLSRDKTFANFINKLAAPLKPLQLKCSTQRQRVSSIAPLPSSAISNVSKVPVQSLPFVPMFAELSSPFRCQHVLARCRIRTAPRLSMILLTELSVPRMPCATFSHAAHPHG